MQSFHGKPGIRGRASASECVPISHASPALGMWAGGWALQLWVCRCASLPWEAGHLGRASAASDGPSAMRARRWALQSSIKPGRAGRRPCDGGGALGCSHGMCPHLVRLGMPGRLGRGRSCSHDPGKPFGKLSMSRFGALELRRARGRGHGMCPRLVRLQMPHRSPSLCRGGSAALSSGPHFGRLFEAAGFRGARAVGPSATQPCVPVAGGQRR